jgi:hypothetical protein
VRHVCAEVPHRQFVFTIPKRLRIYFRLERRLLGDLCRAAARTVITVYRAASGRPDAVPGMIGAIQTFGQFIHFHPHIHALVSEGVFLPDGTFVPLPKLATERFDEPLTAAGRQHPPVREHGDTMGVDLAVERADRRRHDDPPEEVPVRWKLRGLRACRRRDFNCLPQNPAPYASRARVQTESVIPER